MYVQLDYEKQEVFVKYLINKYF